MIRRCARVSSKTFSVGSWLTNCKKIEQFVWDKLEEEGYVIVERFLEEEQCKSLRNEIDSLRAEKLVPNATHFVDRDGHRNLLIKSKIFETETHIDGVLEKLPCLSALHEDTSLLQALQKGWPKLRIHSQSIKVQYNAGKGGCFPMHFDSEPSVDARVLTAICYLNDGWKEQDGGQLRLYPFPHDPLDIQPVSGRLVMFSSRNMLHRVLPSSKERYCFTMWFKESVGGVHQTTLPYPSLKEGADVQLVLANQEFRRLLGKAVYADEWANSLVESHPDSTGRSLALEKHWKDVGIIQHVFRHVLPELLHPKKQNLQGLRWF